MGHDKKKESGKIQRAEMQFLQNTLNYTLQDRIRNEDIRGELEVKDINEIIAIYRRQWWDHLQRMTAVSYTHLDVYKRQVYMIINYIINNLCYTSQRRI